MVRIKDIAQALGVSVSTVSKGLNGASDISEELRQIVLDTAVEMGYTTKSSRRMDNHRICVFVTNMAYEKPDDFGYEIILGFRQNAFRRKWHVDVMPITSAFQEEEKYDTFLLRNGYGGAFLLGLTVHDEWMKQFKTTTMPTVLLDNFIPDNPDVCGISTDSYEGIALAVNHLYTLDHKRIAFLNTSPDFMLSGQRQEAFENAMDIHTLPIRDELTARSFFASGCAKDHVPGFLEAGATAIICGSDQLALDAIDECRKHGCRVPWDISVVGFDDTEAAAASVPALTTIRQERNALGKCAYVILQSLIQHITISKTFLRPSLVVRESTAKIWKGY